MTHDVHHRWVKCAISLGKFTNLKNEIWCSILPVKSRLLTTQDCYSEKCLDHGYYWCISDFVVIRHGRSKKIECQWVVCPMIGKERVEPVLDWEAPPCSSGEAPTPPWHDPAHWSSTLSASSEPRSRVHKRYPCILREAMTKWIMLHSDSSAKPDSLQPPL